jgi:hypothetical protein
VECNGRPAVVFHAKENPLSGPESPKGSFDFYDAGFQTRSVVWFFPNTLQVLSGYSKAYRRFLCCYHLTEEGAAPRLDTGILDEQNPHKLIEDNFMATLIHGGRPYIASQIDSLTLNEKCAGKYSGYDLMYYEQSSPPEFSGVTLGR